MFRTYQCYDCGHIFDSDHYEGLICPKCKGEDIWSKSLDSICEESKEEKESKEEN